MPAAAAPPNVGWPWYDGGYNLGACPYPGPADATVPPNVGYPAFTGFGTPIGSPCGPAATGATAGAPGSFTPTNSTAPANLAAMTGITASPATAWTTGQYVVLGDTSHAHWTGTAWAAGNA